MPIDILPYRHEFDAQIAEVQKHLWSSDTALNAAYLKWKYRDNPFLGETLIQLAVTDGRVVGMRGAFGTLWEVGDDRSRHVLPYADDFVIAPEERNRGLASRLLKAAIDDLALRGFPYAINLSAGAITFVNSLVSGWRSAGSFRPLRLSRKTPTLNLLRRVARRAPFVARAVHTVENPFGRLDRLGKHRAGPVSLSREPRPEAMAALVARLPWDGRVRHIRSPAYLSWRFRNPLHEYRFLFWERDGELRGYLVLQRYLSGRNEAARVNIADWEAMDERARADLLATALHWGRFRRLDAWSTDAGAALRLLEGSGFEPLDRSDIRSRSEGLLVRRLESTAPGDRWMLAGRDLLDIHNWELRMLYSMRA